jgi:mono/diheme cytochrome c family protein
VRKIAGILFAFLLSVAPAGAADAKRGKQLYIATCWGCHPHGGNILSPKKPLVGPEFEKKFPQDSMIFDLVRKGVPKSVMSPFPKERLNDDQLNDIIAYLRTLNSKTPGSPLKKRSHSGASSVAGCSAAGKNELPGRSRTP